MKITITGSLGNVGSHLSKTLIKAGHQLTIVSSAEERKSAIEGLGASAAIGSIYDAKFLQAAFAGSDAVFAMTPPNLGGQNVVANTARVGKAIAEAIEGAGVRRVVMLSSIGADLPENNGPIAGMYQIEKIYDQIKNVSFTYLRAGFFYTNFYNDIPLIKGAGIIGANYPGTLAMPLAHPSDIAAAAAKQLQSEAEGDRVRYIVSDIRTPNEISSVLGKAIGKSELPWVEFTDEQSLEGMVNAGVSEEVAGLYTEMGAGMRKGLIPADFQHRGSAIEGKIKLEDFAKEFAEKF